MLTAAHDRYGSIDDYLGPGDKRFFGVGHRRVRHLLRDIVVGRGTGPGHATATAGVEYPFDWSSKAATGFLRPHLSTIDALLFGVQLAELSIAASQGLTDAQRRTMWLRRVDIRTGVTPNEDGLERFDVSAELLGTRSATDEFGDRVSTVAMRVGKMKVRCEVGHEAGAEPPRPGFRKVGLTDTDARLFSDGYKSRHQRIDDVRVDRTANRAEATVRVSSAPGEVLPGEGMEAAYRPHVSMVDCFVIALQLGQVLLYELDRFDRGNSNTLWMRRTTMVADTPLRPSAEPFVAAAELVRPKLVEAKGGIWRTADIVADCLGIRMECAVTHQLPGLVHAADLKSDVVRIPLSQQTKNEVDAR